MDPSQFFTASRLVIVAGKGGVGKTAVSAALGWGAAATGLEVLIVEVESDGALARCFGKEPSDYAGQVLFDAGSGRVSGRSITGDRALRDYLDDHGLKRLGNRLLTSGTLDVVATAAPGIEDLLVLGKIKQLERAEVAQLIIVDAPAAGHAISFLLAAQGLRDAVASGPIRTQADDVVAMLDDPQRCQVMLVTLAEETPVNEAVETAFALEDRVGVSLGPIVVNALVSGLDDPLVDRDATWMRERAAGIGCALAEDVIDAAVAAHRFDCDRAALQREQTARLADQLPLHQLRLPLLRSGHLDIDDIATLGKALLAEIEAMAT
ncbi:MAG: ArsA family ATPase [Acidimicrobiia bacterium]